MKNKIFIYLTDYISLKIVNKNNKFTPEFELNRNSNLFYLLPSKQTINTLDNLSKDVESILIYEYIDCNVFEKEFQNILSNYDNIYLCHHSNGTFNDGSSLMGLLIISKNITKINIKKGVHKSEDKFYSTAINFIEGKEDRIQKALLAFEGNTELNALCNLHKQLTLLPLKLKDNWTQESYNAEIERLKKMVQLKPVIGKLNSIEFKDKKNEFCDQLNKIEKEMLNQYPEK